MMDGASVLEGYVPETDATVATRILEAGGHIVGKAVCEYFSFSSAGHTSGTGRVESPLKRGYSPGGSSTGSAVLLVTEEADMALGGDQAGSIRIPSAACGLYGMKPTWGLVPYTGIISSEFNIDHTGPMTRDVADNALLLEVLAGPDGIDTRHATPHPRVHAYTEALGRGAEGMRLAVVEEGFGWPTSMPEVDATVREAATRFRELGATVETISFPWHRDAFIAWMGFALEGYYTNLLVGNGHGINHGGLYVTSLNDKLAGWRERANELPYNLRYGAIAGQYMKDATQGHYYARAHNLARQATAAYDELLSRYDLLLMPTVPQKSRPYPDDIGVAETIRLALETSRTHAVQPHAPPGDVDPVRHRRRVPDRHDARRRALRRAGDISRGERVRARGRLAPDRRGRLTLVVESH